MSLLDKFFNLKSKITEKLDNHDFIIQTCKRCNVIENKNDNKFLVHPLKKALYNIINKMSDNNFIKIAKNFNKLINIFHNNEEHQRFILYHTLIQSLMDKKIYNLYIKLYCNNLDKPTLELFIDTCEILFYNYQKTKISLEEICIFYNLLYINKILNKSIIEIILNHLIENKNFLEACNFLKNKELQHYIKIIEKSFNGEKIPNILRFKIMNILEK